MRSQFKKVTSVFLSLVIALGSILLVSALSLTKASAATAGSYFVRITFNVEEAGNFEEMFCKNKAANWGTETNDAVGCTIKYKKNNGTGDEGYFSWDFGNSGGKYGSALTGSDYAWVGNLANESGEHTITATVPGFPIGFYSSTDDNRVAAVGGNTRISYTKIEAGSSSSNMTTLWTGRAYHESQNKWKSTYIYQSSTYGNDTEPFVVIKEGGFMGWGRETSGDETECVSTTSKTWNMPYAKTVSAITGSSSVNVPKTGTATADYTAGTVKDQYGVNWYQDASLSMDETNGCTFSNGTLSVPSSANRASNYTVSIKETCGSASATKNVTIKVFDYDITFKNENGDILQETTCAYDAVPQYTGATPTKDSDVQYSYEFDGWDRELAAAREDAEYTAKYKSILNKYTVKFQNDDGTELQSGLWEYGSTPVYSGSTPEKASNAEFDYTFAGWDKEIDKVTSDATYKATYTSSKRGYTVEWLNWDTSPLEKDENVLYGTIPTFDGETPTKPEDIGCTYTFKGWSPAVSEVTGNTVYTAAFNSVLKKYTITFKNEDGTKVLQTKQVEYGEKPSYTGHQTPTKPYTNRHHYTFNNTWSPEITSVTGDAEYTAQFDEALHSFTYYNDGDTHHGECACGYKVLNQHHVMGENNECEICHQTLANYNVVDDAKKEIPKSFYFTEESYSAVTDAVAAVEEGLPSGRQSEVNAMAEAIRTAIDNLEPISRYTVSVTSGSVKQEVIKSVSRYYYIATVSAPKTNSSGQKFSYWEKTDGTKVATYRNYSFLVTEDITLRPVYGVSKDSADFPLYASRVINIRDNGDKTYSILAEHSASTTVERITSHGVLITTDPSIGTNKDAMITTNEDVQDFATQKSDCKLTGLLEIPVTFNTSGTVYARSYIIDSEGIVHLGEIYSFNVNGASTSASDEEIIAVDSVETVVEQNEAEEVTDESAQTGSVWSTILNAIMTVIARIFNFIKASAAIIKF